MMKRILACVLLLVMLICSVSCSFMGYEMKKATTDVTSEQKTSEIKETEKQKSDEVKDVNYSEEVPKALQGVWCDASLEGMLSFYAFRDNKMESFVVTLGRGGGNIFSGTFTVAVAEGKINYQFNGGTAYSKFQYEKNVLTLTNANGAEMKKMTSADLMAYLEDEETKSNHKGVFCLADLIINYFGGSAESSLAVAKKDSANAIVKAAGEAALRNLKTETDKVQQLTWYTHKNQPKYVDICPYIYPYIGKNASETWLRIKLNYTDAQTDNGWIFFKQVIFSIDGQNTTKSFSSSELTRDNDTEVWEIADFQAVGEDFQMLQKIANSTETIIRFEGNQYYYDHVVTRKEKAAILDVLAAYEYLLLQ